MLPADPEGQPVVQPHDRAVLLRPYQGGTWIATADLGGDRDIGMDTDPGRAVEKALAALGWRYAREMAEGEWGSPGLG